MHDRQIIGYRRNGCPIRAIRGASEATTEATVTEVKETTTEPPKPTPTADDIAKLNTALTKEREARKAAETAAKTASAKARELESAGQTDLEKAIAAARREADEQANERVTAAQQRANARLITAEVRAAAAEKQFRNPAQIAKLIDLTSVEVNDDGEVDTVAINRQLDELAKTDAYLLVDTGPKRPQGDVGQGVRPPVVPEATPGMGRLIAAYAEPPKK